MRATVEIRSNGTRLADIAPKTRLIAKRLGWSHALLWFCTSFARRLSLHIFVVTTHSIDDQPGHANVKTTGLEARLLTRDDVRRFFDRDHSDSYSRAFAAEALSRNDRCVGLLENGALIWYCWFAQGAAPVFKDVEAVVEPPFLYGYNAYSDDHHRGRGLHQTGVEAAARIFAQEGYQAFTAYMEADNPAPLIASRRMGERVVGFVLVHQGTGAVRWLATPGCRKGGFRLRRKSHTRSALDGLTKVCN